MHEECSSDDKLVLYLNNFTDKNIQITNKYSLMNGFGVENYVYYEILNGDDKGYAVLDLKSKQVTEFSFGNQVLKDDDFGNYGNIYYLVVT